MIAERMVLADLGAEILRVDRQGGGFGLGAGDLLTQDVLLAARACLVERDGVVQQA